MMSPFSNSLIAVCTELALLFTYHKGVGHKTFFHMVLRFYCKYNNYIYNNQGRDIRIILI